MRIDGISAPATGGASGLGLATAERLMDHGVLVTILDRPTSDGEQVARCLGNRVRFAPLTSPARTKSGRP